MKIKGIKLLENKCVSAFINNRYYVGSYELIGDYVHVTYLRNICSEKQTTLRIKMSIAFEIEKLLAISK